MEEVVQPPEPAARSRTLAVIAGFVLVLAACGLLTWPGLADTPFHTKGEPREALVTWEMLHGGGWILPKRNGIEVPSKPPLFHWMAAGIALAQGQLDERAVRLASALSSVGAAALLYGAAVVVFDVPVATLGTLLLVTTFEWQRSATSARVDMTLAFGLTLALTALLLVQARPTRTRVLAFYAGVVCAVLAKGPVGAVLPLLHVLLLLIADRSFALLRALRPWWGLPIAGLLAGAWYALALGAGGEGFVARQVVFENVQRLLGGSSYEGGHQHTSLYLLGSLVAGFLPWTIFFPALASRQGLPSGSKPPSPAGALLWGVVFALLLLASFAPRPLVLGLVFPLLLVSVWHTGRRAPVGDPRLCLALWVLLVFAFYVWPSSKRGVYLLPAHPALALLLADAVRRLAPPLHHRAAAILAALAGGLAVILGALALFLVGGPAAVAVLQIAASTISSAASDHILAITSVIAQQGACWSALLAVGAVFAWLAAVMWRGRIVLPVVSLLVTVAAVSVSIRQFVLPAIAAVDSRGPLRNRVAGLLASGESLASFREFDYGFVFYSGARVPVIHDLSGPRRPEIVLVAERHRETFLELARNAYELLRGIEAQGRGNMGRILVFRRIGSATSSR